MNSGLTRILVLIVVLGAVGTGLIIADDSKKVPDAVGLEGIVTSTLGIPAAAVEANAEVTRVVDGDTLVALLDNGETWTVRLLGIDTPETVDPRKAVECFGKEASQTLTDLVDGTRVYLEADMEADEKDRYGRLLRNVYLSDGTDVNALLVANGYAHALTSFPLNAERKVELRALESEAREAERGLWALDACQD